MFGDYQSPDRNNNMQDTIQLSRNISLSDKERLTLFNKCKVDSNLNIFYEVHKKSTDGLYSHTQSRIEKEMLEKALYLSNIALKEIRTEHLSPALALKHGLSKREIDPMRLNRDINRIRSYFDIDKPIYHVVWSKLYDINRPDRWTIPIEYTNRIGIDNPDAYRMELIRAMRIAGLKDAVIFGLDEGDNGLYHAHSVTQGYIRPHNWLMARTGIGYIKIPGDRKENFEIDEENPNRITGFNETLKYCLQKYYPHKRAYKRI